MIACHGRVQREGEVTHVITDRLEDLSDLLRSVGERDEAPPVGHGRGHGITRPAGPDPRRAGGGPGSHTVQGADIGAADPRSSAGIKVPIRDFR